MILGITERDDLGEGVQQIETPEAIIIIGYPGKNGFCIANKDSFAGDPPEIRFIDPLGASGKWSFCVGSIEHPGEAVEVAMFQGKLDEQVRDRPDIMRGCVTLHLQDFIKNPDDPRDDGVYLAAMFVPGYTWINGLDLVHKDFPVPPKLVLPPVGDRSIVKNPVLGRIPQPPTPPPVPTPSDPFPPDEPLPPDEEAVRQAWIAEDAKHRSELDQIAGEFAAAANNSEFVPDEKTREAYRSGRNKDLKSIHDDMVQRHGSDPGPCQWKP